MGYMFQSPPILHAVLICGALGTTYSVDVSSLFLYYILFANLYFNSIINN